MYRNIYQCWVFPLRCKQSQNTWTSHDLKEKEKKERKVDGKRKTKESAGQFGNLGWAKGAFPLAPLHTEMASLGLRCSCFHLTFSAVPKGPFFRGGSRALAIWGRAGLHHHVSSDCLTEIGQRNRDTPNLNIESATGIWNYITVKRNNCRQQ